MTRPDKGTTLTCLLVLVGTLLVQKSWALVVPPFRGIDEHDHAFRAAAVARGEWRPEYQRVERGRGDVLTVPDDVVAAAEPVCTALRYTGPDDCSAISRVGGGLVTVGSAAARYHPAFYWLVGTAGRPFEGTTALYAMRAAASLICALLISIAFGIARRTSTTVWPHLSILVALTPVMTYSTAIAAPNGTEMAAALLAWLAGLGLLRARDEHHERTLLGLMTGGVIVVATVRSLGPLWVVLIVVTIAALAGRARIRELAKTRTSALVLSAAAMALAMAAGAAWTVTAGTNRPVNHGTLANISPWPDIMAQPVLWLLQSVAAFPSRDEMAPVAVYAIGLCLIWIVGAMAWRVGGRRGRTTLASVVLVSAALALVFTLLSFDAMGFGWQGRYGWPYAMGFLLVSGYLVDSRSTTTGPHGKYLVWIAAIAAAVATVIGQLHVLHNQLRISVLADDPAWVRPSDLVVVALTLSGLLLLAAAGRVSRERPR